MGTDRRKVPSFVPRGWIPFEAFSDEFEGSSLNPAKWWDYEAKDDGSVSWLGREPSLFAPANVFVKDGMLQLLITADGAMAPGLNGYHTYRSAAVKSKVTRKYLALTVRAKIGHSLGASAIWLYRHDAEKLEWTEIDVLESAGDQYGNGYANNQQTMNTNLHAFYPVHTDDALAVQTGQDLDSGFHDYGLLWTQTEIKFYFDGNLVRTSANRVHIQALNLVFDRETMPDWMGLPPVDTLPDLFQIQHVRSWIPSELK